MRTRSTARGVTRLQAGLIEVRPHAAILARGEQAMLAWCARNSPTTCPLCRGPIAARYMRIGDKRHREAWAHHEAMASIVLLRAGLSLISLRCAPDALKAGCPVWFVASFRLTATGARVLAPDDPCACWIDATMAVNRGHHKLARHAMRKTLAAVRRVGSVSIDARAAIEAGVRGKKLLSPARAAALRALGYHVDPAHG